VSKSNKPRPHLDRRIEKSIKDEIRIDLLRILSEQSATPRELAEMLEEDPGEILHHIVEMWADNCIEVIAEEAPHEDPAERRYRLHQPFYIDDRETHDLPIAEREEVAATVVQSMVTEVVGALRGGTFGYRSDNHLSVKQMKLDERGWREFTALLLRTLKEAETIEESCKERLGLTGEAGIETVVGLMGFERSESGAR
jgi:hypothetical protein